MPGNLEIIDIDSLLAGVETSSCGTEGVRDCRLAVFGSRSLKDARALEIIEKHVKELNAQMIVTAAEPAGICQIAQVYARQAKLPLLVHFLQADKYARGMWEHRSDHVIQSSDIVLLIHDGESRGTYNEMQRTQYFHKPYIYERIPVDSNLARIV